MIRATVTAKRLEQIERIQSQLRKLADAFEKDFGVSLAPAIRKDLHSAVDNLDLLKGIYKSKTDRKA